ncbi:hypothetical protein [Paenibacillus lautus]|uniref:hypothetical protein n=1 Tax=Paenibacillus lautus TaxID=1401 RepID=UPI001C7D262F|nr:hypothetical protein [Paenibacillus lautus]MBX4152238.1 hypothetical protein [Paenibacillus lautus]
MADYKIKVNKNHGGKEFKGSFRFIGKVGQVSKKNQQTDSWDKVPYYQEKMTKSDNPKPRRSLQFNIETAFSNNLKVEVAGMEQKYVYAYSRKHNKTVKLDWNVRFEKDKWKDLNGKVTDIDNTYHLIETPWDKAKQLTKYVEDDVWVEVKGEYEFESIDGDNGEIEFKKRTISSVRPVVNGKIIDEEGNELPIKVNGKEIVYVQDFESPDFIEVNSFNMQIGVKSTYQDETTGDTKVNAVFLKNGKERSEPMDVELIVYQKEVVENKKPLADAFATLKLGDFIEVTGQDNNRVTFSYVDIVEDLASDDPFADIDDTEKVTRKERVTNGDKKGLEITGYVIGSKMLDFLTEEEFKKTAELTSENPFETSEDPFSQTGDDPFGSSDEDPFA